MSNPFLFAGDEKQLDAMAQGLLIPKDTAKVRGDGCSWFELAQITGAKWETENVKPFAGGREGDTVGNLVISMVIDPQSPNTKSGTMRFRARLHFNPTAMNEGRDAFCVTITKRSYGKLSQLAKALNLSPTFAKDPTAAAEKITLGARVTVGILHRKAEDGTLWEEAELFAPEGLVWDVG